MTLIRVRMELSAIHNGMTTGASASTVIQAKTARLIVSKYMEFTVQP